MKNYLYFGLLALACAASACQPAATNIANNNAADNIGANTATAPKTEPSKAPAAPLKPGEVPFDGFSNIKTTAKAGDWVLSFDEKRAAKLNAKPDETTLYYNYKMTAPGDGISELDTNDKTPSKVANAYIIALPKGQKAKVGDTVLTWWQSGGGMFRGYVVEAGNPAEPTVRYLDMSGKDSENTQDKLKPDSFIVLKDPFQIGMQVYYKEGNQTKEGQIVNVNADKCLVRMISRSLKVFDKSDLNSVPLKLALKAGDKVKAAIFGTFNECEVVSTDEKLGKVVIKRANPTEEKTIDFGNIYK